jgi:hypothetical protein
MSHSTYNHENHSTSKNSVRKLHLRSLSIAVGTSTAFVYTLCILFIILAPTASMTFFSYVLHADLTQISRVVTWGSFIAGLLFWSLGPALYAALISRIYNRFTVQRRTNHE